MNEIFVIIFNHYYFLNFSPNRNFFYQNIRPEQPRTFYPGGNIGYNIKEDR